MAIYDISPAEFLIIRLLHELEESDLAGIVAKANGERDETTKEWSYTTVQSFLTRLMNKGYVIRRKQWGRWIYRNKVSIFDTIECFLSRFFGSSGRSILLCHFLQDQRLSKKQEKYLKELIEATKPNGSPEKEEQPS